MMKKWLRCVETGAPVRPREEPRAGARHVLVVDDNVDSADSLAELVRMFGHTADVAYDGPAALAKALARPPDVVLCDIGLPGMNGYDVARALRSMPVRPARLIAVSGYARADDLKSAVDAGFDRHLAKPVDPATIGRLIAEDGVT